MSVNTIPLNHNAVISYMAVVIFEAEWLCPVNRADVINCDVVLVVADRLARNGCMAPWLGLGCISAIDIQFPCIEGWWVFDQLEWLRLAVDL